MKYCYHCMHKNHNESNVCSICGRILEQIEQKPYLLKAGSMLDNRYLVGNVLGEGGFGITYVGIDTVLDIKVAIKEYYPTGMVSRDLGESSRVFTLSNSDANDIFAHGKKHFLSEARILAKLSDEAGIVNVTNFFEANNTAYIIMEYLDGKNLGEYIKSVGQISYDNAVCLLMPVMISLGKLHDAGMLHRDISPDNIMLVGNDVKLIDFGAAKEFSDEKSFSLMLKPGYAPVEQYMRHGEQGPWTDIYALCATIYKCITGSTPDDSVTRNYEDDVKSPSQLGIEIDPLFEKVLMKGLAIKKKDRWQDINDLISALIAIPALGIKLEDIEHNSVFKSVKSYLSGFTAEPVDKAETLPAHEEEEPQREASSVPAESKAEPPKSAAVPDESRKSAYFSRKDPPVKQEFESPKAATVPPPAPKVDDDIRKSEYVAVTKEKTTDDIDAKKKKPDDIDTNRLNIKVAPPVVKKIDQKPAKSKSEEEKPRKKHGCLLAIAFAIITLLVIILFVVYFALFSNRKTIKPNESVVTPSDYSFEEQESLGNVEVLQEVKSSQLPSISESYKTINLKDATFNTAVLLDAESNEIIAGLQYDKKIYPSSLTKLMTLLVAVENIDDMQAKYKFTDKDIDPLIEENASLAGFVAGDEVTMEDLLYAAILPSGADGTLGLANAIAGSEKDFVKMMNDKVAELGLTDTNFVNASGLHDKQHYTTAQDIAVITKACMDNETCRKVLCADKWTTKPTKEFEDGIELNSIFHSRFGGYFIDADQDGEEDAKVLGGKTGFTDEAMFTLSTVVDYNGKEYICVTMKSEGDLIVAEDAIMIFENYLPGAVGTPATDDDDSSNKDTSNDHLQTLQCTSDALLHPKPSSESETLAIIKKGDKVLLYSSENDWLLVDYNGTKGYAFENCFSIVTSKNTKTTRLSDQEIQEIDAEVREHIKDEIEGEITDYQFRTMKNGYAYLYYFTEGGKHGYSVGYNLSSGQYICEQNY